MLKSRIFVDLPSAETTRRMGPIEWTRSLFGAKIDLRSGKEELTVSAFSLVEGLITGFKKAGVDDAISFLVDKKVVYLDTNDVPNDLPLIAKAAQESGVLDRKFKEMHLVLAHRGAGLHTILDVRIQSQVILGQAEMQLDLSSRLEELRVHPGENAQTYAERVKAFAAKPESFEPYRVALDQFTHRVADALRATLIGSKVQVDQAVVQVIRPNAEQIGRFRNLPFGDQVAEPAYRPVPTMQRQGAYADPFYYYYYDPYYDFMSFVLVDSMIHDAMWHSHYVHVVDPYGHLLFTGYDAPMYVNDGWIGHHAIGYGGGGDLYVNDSIGSYSGDPAMGGFDGGGGGGDWNDGGGGGDVGGSSSCSSTSSCSGASSCSSSSCSSGSSCGSSCSGSSCGSSCSS
jgi:hypothetical protein